jgi:hypothetical protein
VVSAESSRGQFLGLSEVQAGASLGTGVSAGFPTAKNTERREHRKRKFADYIMEAVTV